MKFKLFVPAFAISALFVSCAPKTGGEDYDVSNPYSAPDYGDGNGSPYQDTNVNPAYDAPAAYQDSAPAVSQPTAPSRPSTPSRRASTLAKVHTVVAGDSLWKISKKYGVSVDAIKKANGMTKDTAVLGAKLQIPAH